MVKPHLKLFFLHLRRNLHFIGLKDNEIETNFTSSAQAELLNDLYLFFSPKMTQGPNQLCPFQQS